MVAKEGKCHIFFSCNLLLYLTDLYFSLSLLAVSRLRRPSCSQARRLFGNKGGSSWLLIARSRRMGKEVRGKPQELLKPSYRLGSTPSESAPPGRGQEGTTLKRFLAHHPLKKPDPPSPFKLITSRGWSNYATPMEYARIAGIKPGPLQLGNAHQDTSAPRQTHLHIDKDITNKLGTGDGADTRSRSLLLRHQYI